LINLLPIITLLLVISFGKQMKLFLKAVASIVVTSAIGTGAYSKVRSSESKPVIQLAWKEVKPLSYIDKDGNHSGVFSEYLLKVVKKTGLPHNFSELPIKRIYGGLVSGKLHLILTPQVPSLEKFITLSTLPISTVDVGVIRLKSSSKISKQEELRGKSIVKTLGYKYAGILPNIDTPKSNTDFLDVTDHKRMIKVIKSKRYKYALIYKTIAEKIINDDQGSKDSNLIYDSLVSSDLYYAVSKKAALHDTILKAANAYTVEKFKESKGPKGRHLR
jgi:ABC-type amino acid transport substrate-binding protein